MSFYDSHVSFKLQTHSVVTVTDNGKRAQLSEL